MDDSPRTHRVAITGLGLVTPLGTGVDKSWEGLKSGRSGVGPITAFDASQLPTRFAGEVGDFDAVDFMGSKEARRLDRSQQFAMAAAEMAFNDAALSLKPGEAEKAAVIIGSGVGGLARAQQEYDRVLSRGAKALSPLFLLAILPNMSPAQIAIRFGFKGPNWATNSACATSAHAVGEAGRLIQRGDAVVALAGGTEAPICLMGVAGFGALRALSTRNDDPQGASRPFDTDRDGFVLSEGASVLLLEELSHAQDRGATIYGELVGYGVTGDAHHLTAPAPGHEGAIRCMRAALEEARMSPADLDYINAHATATDIGDRLEAEAIQHIFSPQNPGILVSSTKSMTGHMTGAGGGAEAAFSLLSMRDSIIPPTINLDSPEEGITLDCVPNQSREVELETVMSNAFGFGGTNVSLVFRKV